MEQTLEKDPILPKLKKVYDDIGQDMQFFKTGLNFTKILVSQGHSAESIASYLVLHCGVYANHFEIKDTLIRHDIVKA